MIIIRIIIINTITTNLVLPQLGNEGINITHTTPFITTTTDPTSGSTDGSGETCHSAPCHGHDRLVPTTTTTTTTLATTTAKTSMDKGYLLPGG